MPGRAGAERCLEAFAEGRLAAFSADRARADRTSTSRLSPHIHFGEISVRYVYHVALAKSREWAG